MLQNLLGKLKPYLFNIWIFIPVIIYFGWINEYALNLPYRDDYHAILKFLLDFKNANGIGQKMQVLFAQHNEHRIVASRIIYILYNTIFGGINFKSIIWIGNLQLVTTYLVIASLIKQVGGKFWSIPVLLLGICLFDANNYENTVFAMGSIQNFGVIMWLVLSLYFYNKSTKAALVAAVVCQALCAFSSGNGMIAGFALVLFNIFSKNKIKGLVSGVSFILLTALYFMGLKLGSSVPPANAPANTVNNIITYFLNMVGAHFDMSGSVFYGVVLLVAAIVILYFILKQKQLNNYLALLALLAFLVGSMLVTAKFRLSTGLNTAFASRYLIYGNLLAALIIVLVYLLVKNKIAQWVVAGVACLVLISFYQQNKERAIGGFERQRYRMEVDDFQRFPLKEDFAKIADSACKANIYCITENMP